ncbi:MAG: hypothetical protein AAFY17_14275, partial [Cyanobacteria bacterium J06642_11]
HCVFEQTPNQFSHNQAPFLLVLQPIHQQLWGIALETPPDLVELPTSAFQPMAADQRFKSRQNWISHVAVIPHEETKRTLLLLNLKTVFQTEHLTTAA